MHDSCGQSSCGTQTGSSCGSNNKDEELLKKQLRQIQHKLLVMSGKGGVGKSSIAAYLALGLARRGYRVGLLDVDLHGPSIPKILGISGMFQVNEHKRLVPHKVEDHLEVVSIQCLLEEPDSAIIWRGPVKHGVIQQFIGEVEWGPLDFLIIDSPPGTGDEPLSVAQTVPDAHAVIVTTPQEVALNDVRKSINFCKKVHMPILGLVENMGGFVCPHCDRRIALFGSGGGKRTAERMNIPFLGSLPFDPRVVEAGDAGSPREVVTDTSNSFGQALNELLDEIVERCSPPASQSEESEDTAETRETQEVQKMEKASFKAAVPLANGVLCNHFGHCERFAVVNVKDGKIDGKVELTPPPHEPGVLPRWLSEQGVDLVIAGGMGQRAIGLFAERGVRVITGAPVMDPESLVQQYLEGTLVTGANVCDH